VVALLASPAPVRAAVALAEDGDMVVAASTDGGLVGTTLPALAVRELTGQDAGSGSVAAVSLDAAASPASWSHAAAVPMVVDGVVVGALLVGAIDRDAHAALASQVGLGLARVDAANEVQAREAGSARSSRTRPTSSPCSTPTA
jgi:hypothetical protein